MTTTEPEPPAAELALCSCTKEPTAVNDELVEALRTLLRAAEKSPSIYDGDLQHVRDLLHTVAAGPANCDDALTTVPRRFAEQLASLALDEYCGLIALPDYPPDPCRNKATAIRWEDGFADSVCDQHAARTLERGGLVVYPHRPEPDTEQNARRRRISDR